jgi:hypothetical protein
VTPLGTVQVPEEVKVSDSQGTEDEVGVDQKVLP